MKPPKYLGARKFRTSQEVWHCESAGCRRYATRQMLFTKDPSTKRYLCEKHTQLAIRTGEVRAIQMLKEYKVHTREMEKFRLAEAAVAGDDEQETLL